MTQPFRAGASGIDPTRPNLPLPALRYRGIRPIRWGWCNRPSLRPGGFMTRILTVCLQATSLIAALGGPALAAESAPYQPDPRKVLRYALERPERSLDPHRVNDLYSNILTAGIFDSPLVYDYLARPLKLVANTLATMPEMSADQKTITLRLRPGIYFADDAAFKGKKRELVADDYVYSMKRLMDPRLAAPSIGELEGTVLGAAAYIAEARKAGRLNYDAPLAGLRALDRYTWQIRLTRPNYLFLYDLTVCNVACAVAREVVEAYGDDVGAHPVGTGAYRLSSWRRGSKLVFTANPNYREEYWQGAPAENDVAGQAMLAQMKGRRLPLAARIEVSIIEEQAPRWLAFLNNEHDLLFNMGYEFANEALRDGRLAPKLQQRGMQMAQVGALELTHACFNMEDPLVGGYSKEKVALRRAISLAYKTSDEINIIWKGQATLAHAPYPPNVAGYVGDDLPIANDYDPGRARSLLDAYGYRDIDGDGYRETPDGKPLVLVYSSAPSARNTEFDVLWKRSMDDIGLRLTVRKAAFQELVKEVGAGKYMIWSFNLSGTAPDAENWLSALYGPNEGNRNNFARFKLKAFDDAFEQAARLPDGAKRSALYQQMARLVASYAPWKVNAYRTQTDIWQPYLAGYARPLVAMQSWWKFVDVDPAKQMALNRD
jgi:ABC-type transport system substrate-binding protein